MPKKRIKFSFSIFQAVFLGIGAITTLLGIFVLGILVGREMKGISIFDREAKSQVVKMKIEPLPGQTPVQAQIGEEEKEKPAVINNLTSKPVITFYDTLTKPRIKAAGGITKTDEPSKKIYAVQVGAMKNKTLADEMASKLRKNKYSAYVVSLESPEKGLLYKVRLGTFSSKEDAREEAAKIKNNEGLPATVVEK